MTSTQVTATDRRVRHDVRDGVVVIAFSAAASTGARPGAPARSCAWRARRSEMTNASHVPVLLDRVVALVAPALDRADRERTLMVDATLGLGGHTEAVLERCPQAHVIGIDRDVHALDRSRERLAPYGERVTFVHAVYDEIADVLDELGHPYVDGVLFDLGVSSMQLDLRERGFAYSQDAPLDMRMDDTERAHRRGRAQRVPGRGADPDPQALRRGAVRPPDRRGRGPRAGQGALHHARGGSSSCSTPRSPPRPGAPGDTPRSGRSRRCGSRSTTSSPCCAGRCRPRSTRSGSAAAWW